VIKIIELPPAAALDTKLQRGVLAVNQASVIEKMGDAEFAMQPHALRNRLTPSPDWASVVAAAVEGDLVIGYTTGLAPLGDNPTLSEIGVIVHPSHRRLGTGAELLAWVQRWSIDLGRSTLVSSILAPCPTPTTPVVTAPTGDTFPADQPGWLFAAHHGYTLEQVARVSILRLPVKTLPALKQEALSHADGYRLHTWFGLMPEPWQDGYAALRSRVAFDAPNAGIEVEEEAWDARRVRRDCATDDSVGVHRVTVAAEHLASGQLVAFTEVYLSNDRPDCGFQGYTFARADHRGHHLGLLVKTAAVEALASTYPRVDHIQTDNAGENAYMLNINHALGYELAAVSAQLQKKLG